MEMLLDFSQPYLIQHGHDDHPTELSPLQCLLRVDFFESRTEQFSLGDHTQHNLLSTAPHVQSGSCEALVRLLQFLEQIFGIKLSLAAFFLFYH